MNDWRTEAIDAGARALRGMIMLRPGMVELAAAVVDAVEPIIRADEAEKSDKLAVLCGELLVEREELYTKVAGARKKSGMFKEQSREPREHNYWIGYHEAMNYVFGLMKENDNG